MHTNKYTTGRANLCTQTGTHARARWPRFNPSTLDGRDQFFLLGLVVGLAVYNRVLLDFPAPLVLYKKLLGGPGPLGLRDLEDMQPALGRSLRALLQVGGGWWVGGSVCGRVWVSSLQSSLEHAL